MGLPLLVYYARKVESCVLCYCSFRLARGFNKLRPESIMMNLCSDGSSASLTHLSPLYEDG
jgi:hypothetical protein